eukprot:1153965-Pelagomonas_calceolata.AAC.2
MARGNIKAGHLPPGGPLPRPCGWGSQGNCRPNLPSPPPLPPWRAQHHRHGRAAAQGHGHRHPKGRT